MANQQHLPGQPMTLGNMRELGMHHLIVVNIRSSLKGRHSA
jgi:hypothetical protein